jgi:hypothetical protein
MTSNKFDKLYLNQITIDPNKINSILSKTDEMDTQEILQLSLINKIPLPIITDRDGNNLIHLAILNTNYKSEFAILNYIKFLVQQQVNPDQPNKENQTPLHLACQNQYLTIINFLLEQNINVNYQDNNGLTAFHYLLSGNIKTYEAKEIKEFLIPNPKNKESKIDRDNLLDLKKRLWDTLSTEQLPTNDFKYKYFFDALNRTIESNIINSDKINDLILELKQKLASEKDLNLINDLYLNYRKSIEETISTMWKKFKNNDDIVLHFKEDESLTIDGNLGIIKNSNVKKTLKNKLKETINESLELFDNYQYDIQPDDINMEISNLLSPYLQNKIIQLNDTVLNPVLNLELLDDVKLFDHDNPDQFDFDYSELNNIYRGQIDENAHDFADNIIDLNELSFIGGSRQIQINYNNYNELINILNNFNGPFEINKKVVFLLLIEYFRYNFNFNVILNQQPYIYIDSFDFNTNVNILFNQLKANFGFNFIFIGGLVLNPKYNALIEKCKELYKYIFIEKIDNLGPTIYCECINTLLQFNNNNNNLDLNLHVLFFRLIHALNNDPIHLKESLDNVFKIDTFYQIIAQPGLNHLAVWTVYLFLPNIDLPTLDINNINDDKIQNIVNAIINPINDNNIQKLVIDKKDDMRYLENDTNRIIAKAVLSYYNNMPIKIPKLYLLDLIYYILYPKAIEFKRQYIMNNPGIPFDLDADFNLCTINDPIEFIYDQNKPPSIYGYINILFEDPNNNIYCVSKMKESIELGLLFNGCLPNLMSSDRNNYFSMSLINNNRNNNNNNTFIFNPENNPNQTSYTLPLPFNYYIDSNIVNRPDLQNYFLYIPGRYRPPFKESKKLLFQNQINSYNGLLKKIFQLDQESFTTIFSKLLSQREKISSIYSKLFVTSKLILNNQRNINIKLNSLNNNIIDNLFDFSKLTTSLNNINAYIYLYYYLYKYEKITKLPEFIYYKLDSEKYLLYEENRIGPVIYVQANYGLVGGSNKQLVGGTLTLTNLEFMNQYYFGFRSIKNQSYNIDKENALPPSLDDNLDDFYQLNKIKFITDILSDLVNNNNLLLAIGNNYQSKLNLKEIDKTNFIYLNIAKLIEEIIKDYAEYTLRISIDNSLLQNIPDITRYDPSIGGLQNKTYQVTTILNSSINDLNDIYYELFDSNKEILLNFYNFSDPNINKECQFIIYPNEYTNTTLLQEKYCININTNIFDQLLSKNGQPLLLDNNNKTCINYLISIFNSNILEALNTKLILKPMIHPNDMVFIQTELNNHIGKMYSETYIKTFENFTKAQYEEIKLLILSDENNGNNILFNLKNSFYICFYIMNEYLTDYLWRFNDNYTIDDFKNISTLLNYQGNMITINYLSNIADYSKLKLYDDDFSIIYNDFIDRLNKELEILRKKKATLEQEVKAYKNLRLRLDYNNLKQKIQSIGQNIREKENVLNHITRLSNRHYQPKNLKKNKIIKTYNDLLNDKYGIYSSIWKLLFDDENLLKSSHNLSLINILENQFTFDHLVIDKYLSHIGTFAESYFIQPKYTNINKVLSFIYDLLIHLTKTHLCFGIEIIVRKTVYNHMKNIYPNYSVDVLKDIIDRILKENFIYNNKSSFITVLYEELPEKFVKNSVLIFKDLDDKVNFESQTILELITKLFSLFRNTRGVAHFTDDLLMNLNKNIAGYFELFIDRTIKNWYVVCENTLKYVINHKRITKTHNIIMKN